jgi:dienelactone hydrolase
MTSLLVTQSNRFAAAVPVAPIIDHVTEHLTSNIPHFVETFVGDRYYHPGGRYFHQSPITHARKVRTPTLSICGALDRCTPPGEALQFHTAMLEAGAISVLVTYPEGGHGVARFQLIMLLALLAGSKNICSDGAADAEICSHRKPQRGAGLRRLRCGAHYLEFTEAVRRMACETLAEELLPELTKFVCY